MPIFLLDHLIRSRQHVRRNRQADLLGSFEIDDKFELRGLLHAKISGFSASTHAAAPLPVDPNPSVNPRLFQFFDKGIVEKFSWICILGMGKFFLIEIT